MSADLGLTTAPEPAAWQLGYPLARLKAIASIFRESWKPYVYGAFILPKENTIALELEAGRLIIGEGSVLWGTARLKHAGSVTLFTGERVTIPTGAMFFRGVAYRDGYLGEVLYALDSEIRSLGAALADVWVEVFEEDRPLRRAILDRGFSYVGSKIAASSEIIGVYRLAGLSTRLFEEDGPDLAELATLQAVDEEFATPEEIAGVRAELTAYEVGSGVVATGKPAWAQHYSSYNKRHSWTAFCLSGYDPLDPGFIIKPAEMSKGWKEQNPLRAATVCNWTTAAKHFQHTLSIVSKLPNHGLQRVRFMRLAPGGGELTRHADITDREAGAAVGKVARLHIPIITNPDVEFAAWTARGDRRVRSMREGGCYYLDTRKPHTVINRGTTDRIHLVADVFVDPQLHARLAERCMAEGL